ncbi:Trk family potassium uptake protein [Streptococcus dysgalactiae subsp. equisimilis]|nr:Trk family potassium uptake protein [Streptococcus dysgalactiae subsp. equisimilis]
MRGVQEELRIREGYLITALFWVVLGSFGAIPFMFSETPHMSLTDALFEAISGISTTGATVLTGLDRLPRAILYYRQQLQWFGGMGIVVLAVAIMPMLGIGGMQLYRAEMPGPLKEQKLSPRIADTAKTLWLIYCGLTLVCALAYWAAGMSLFDAVGHSFSTIAIGGFSTHDASIGYFDSPLIEAICMFFLVVSGINFGLHFLAWRRRNLAHYLRDPECRAYLSILLAVFLVTALALVRPAPLRTAVAGDPLCRLHGGLDRHHYRLRPGRLRHLADLPPASAALHHLHRCLRRLHRRRHEGDAHPPGVPPGHA